MSIVNSAREGLEKLEEEVKSLGNKLEDALARIRESAQSDEPISSPEDGGSTARRPGSLPWPSMDVEETDEGLVVTAEVSGLERNSIDVTVERGVLTLSGEKPVDETTRRGATWRRERFRGTFTRRVRLGTDVDPSRATARLQDGELVITIPWIEGQETPTRRIEIL